MVEYNPKTLTLFKRDDDFKVTDELTDRRFAMIKDWCVSTKMDGMSVIVTPEEIFGRTPQTQFRGEQASFLRGYSNQLAAEVNNNPRLAGKSVAVYAELCGPKINGNRHNFDVLRLFAFDIKVNGYWLDWDNFSSLAYDLGFPTVPDEGVMTVGEIITAVRNGRDEYFEGLVARSDPYLYNNKGERLTFKLKYNDLRR